MGSAASTQELAETHPEVKQHLEEMKRLEQLVMEKDKIIRTLETNLKKYSGGGGERPSLMKKDPSQESEKRQQAVRRGEISAEAFHENQVQAAVEYKKVDIPKDEETTQLISKSVESNILFKGLRGEERQECVKAFFKVDLKAGDKAIEFGAVGDNFYVVQTGTLEVFLPMQESFVNVGEIHAGNGFGELALMYNEPRAATIKAQTDCVLWAISRKTFRAIHLHHKMLLKKKYEEYLKKVPQLDTLQDKEIKRLVDAVEEQEFEKGSVIIREGEVGDHFYILVNGEVSYSKSSEGQVGVGGPGDVFGHQALITDETRAATVTATSNVFVLTMGRTEFINLLGSLQDIVKRQDATMVAGKASARVGDGNLMENKHHKNIKFEDLQRKFKKYGSEREIILGQGAFGKVQIVKHKETGETFALKCLNKSQIREYSLEAHVVCERKVMTMIDHTFLLKMHNSFWDDRYVYFLLELCLGGELFTILRRRVNFSEKTTRFYSATVLQAFAHMHNKNIIYRDLKPENLMLDSQGYIKVVDFGLAKVVSDRTWTICGTPDYLAPEIISSSGHNKSADYWALGVLIYELYAGFVPFEGGDTMELYNAILANEVSYPAEFSRLCRDLISKLLNSNQTKRLGNTKEGIAAIQKHRWYSGFDWEGLLNRELPAPIVPVVEHPEDTSNFDDFDSGDDIAPKCDWEPDFPHQVLDGTTQGME